MSNVFGKLSGIAWGNVLTTRRDVLAASLLVLLCSVVGCGPSGPKTYPVVGKVVMLREDEPIQQGTIEFRSLEQMVTARGKIEPDGTFCLTTFEPKDGAVEGEHQVIVQQMIIVEDLSFKSHNHGPRVPARYADYATSGIKLTVKPSANDFLIKLTK